MKFSIVTVSFNSEKTIEETIQSVISQKYKNYEYILVDGGSFDNTLKIVNKYSNYFSKIISEKDFGIYDAINKGIKQASGDVISILHSNDIFFSNQTLSNVYKYFSNNQKLNILLGNVSYKKDFNKKKISRYYSASFFRPWMLRFGFSPPHPSSFIKTEIYKKYGFYEDSYQIAGDFDIFTRYLLKNNLPYQIAQECFVVMQPGGLSNKGIKSFYISTIEILKSLKINNIYSNLFFVLLRFPIKIIQFII